MPSILLILIFFLFANSTLAQIAEQEENAYLVFMERDANGILRFTDRPKTRNPAPRWIGSSLVLESHGSADSSGDPPQAPYIHIESPRQDEALRSNQGILVVHTAASQSEDEENTTDLFLDDVRIASSAAGYFKLENLDRGTHSLRAELKAADGTLLAKSEEVTFHLLRYAIPATE